MVSPQLKKCRQTSLSERRVRKGLGKSLHVLLHGKTESEILAVPKYLKVQYFTSYFKMNFIILVDVCIYSPFI